MKSAPAQQLESPHGEGEHASSIGKQGVSDSDCADLGIPSREPGTNEQQLPQMDPPQFVGGKCQARIAPHRSHPIDAIPL